MANTHSLDLEQVSAQYIYVTDNTSVSITGDITAEIWVKLESLPASQGITPLFFKSGSYRFELETFNLPSDKRGFLQFNLDHGTPETTGFWQSTPATTMFPLATHLYFAFSWKQSSKAWVIYKGTEDSAPSAVASGTGATSDNIADTTNSLLIGNRGSTYMDGIIDEVRLWNTERSSAELVTNYKRELHGSESGLVLYAKLNNNYTDSTGNSTINVSGTPSFTTDVPFADNTTTSTSTTTTSTSTTTTSTSTSTTSTSSSTTTSTTSTISSSSTSTTTSSSTSTSTSTTSTSSSTTTTSTSTTSTSTTLDLKFSVERA